MAQKCSNKRCLRHEAFPIIFTEDAKGENFAKRREKGKILGILKDIEVDYLDDHRCPKSRDLVIPKRHDELCISSSHPIRHRSTLHCSESEAKMLGDWTMQHLKVLYFVL